MTLDKKLNYKVTKIRKLKTFNSCWKKCAEKTRKVLQFLWSAYSTPTPSSWKELLALFFLCLCICVIISGLIHNWMLASLKYRLHLSNIISVMFTVVMFPLLFLVHPMRCMFTIVIPTLGTNKGRDLLLSTCFMLVAINIIPNIIDNVKMVLKLFQCILMTSFKNFMSLTKIVKDIKDELVVDIKEKLTAKDMFYKTDADLEINSFVNQSAIKNYLQAISKDIENNVSKAQTLFSDITLEANKVIAALVFFYLAIRSVWYLKNYLTNLEFDNIYITGKLAHQLQPKKGQLIVNRTASKKLIRSTGLKMSTDEVATCIKQMVISTSYLALSAIIIIADFVIFTFTSQVLQWTLEITPVLVTMRFLYKIEMKNTIDVVFNLSKGTVILEKEANYPRNFTFITETCRFQPSPPNVKIICVVSLLYFIAFITVFLETYALRARRKISASFFEQREQERVKYLQQKLMKESERHFKNTAVFTVSEQHHVSFKR
ncbi:osteoclast stimulatory transmembrane protein [Narcine bancroftii]|uniref:osteoclast stimulatory transmembrane protein n=1 Tax=Narcine bancroftii TaxID=1343680 RepID=UPI0038312B57